ncbi:MAG TPA: bifunctional oligoribonuclease/PAP phosphatase NrnA [Chloroflexota bacterium]|jgi:phosphoesterase RecJ-like protein|nr:bifunctional oligoribonuclease/PAP phosphatase NrnA [Chloroflexota bacterium]
MNAKEMVQKAQNVIVCAHINPDGDTLGSMLGMYHVLTAAGKYAQRACHNTTPPQFTFLPGHEGVGPDIPNRDWDLIICHDASDIQRFGSVYEQHRDLFERVPSICIDHHITNSGWATVNLIDTSAAATAEIVYTFARELGYPITREAATCILTGIFTDSGSFQYQAVSPRTLRAAADLVEAGAPLPQIAHETWRKKTFPSARLWGASLEALQMSPDGRYCWSTVTLDMLRQHRADFNDLEGAVSFMAGIDGPSIVALFKEQGPDEVDVSFRSMDDTDCTVVAVKFGGGGHKKAAGCTVKASLAEAERQVLSEVAKLVGSKEPAMSF